MTQNALVLLTRAMILSFRGRVRLQRGFVSEELRIDQERFLSFRRVTLSTPSRSHDRSPAVFRVRFRFKNLSATANRFLSLIPIPMILAQPGFRSKTWYLGQSTGDFVGHYEFDTVEEAEAYWDSLPLRMMKRRAAPGSITHEIHPGPEHNSTKQADLP